MAFNKIYNAAKRHSRVLLFAMTILGFFSFKAVETMVGSKKASTTLCFEFDQSILTPDADDVVAPGNYVSVTVPNCIKGPRLCGICIEDTDFILDGNDFPDFEDNLDLKNYVIANMNNQLIHGETKVIPGTQKEVTLYFRN